VCVRVCVLCVCVCVCMCVCVCVCVCARTHATIYVDSGGHSHRGAHNVHAMAACVVELFQLHEALHFLPAPATDNGCGEEQGYVLHGLPHLFDTSLGQ